MIPAVYLLGARAYSVRAGLFAALLTAVSPFLNWYGNEIRMYSLFALMTILNQYFFTRIFMEERRADGDVKGRIWLGYIITLILGIFTHYFFIFNTITQAIFFLFYRNIFPKRALRMFALVMLLVIVVFSPWLHFVAMQGAAGNSQPMLAKPTSIDVFNTFSQFLFGFQNDHTNTILVSLWPLLVLLIFLSLRRSQHISPRQYISSLVFLFPYS